MWTLATRIIAVLIAIAYVVAMIVHEHEINRGVVYMCLTLLVPLALIWFSEELGSFTGYVGRGGDIDTETPPPLVAFIGWFFLLGYPVIIYFLLARVH
jgi:hypothetical protein